MATLVEWFPADGSASARFTTGAAAPLRLLRLEGTEPVTVETVTVKSPNQPGATALDVVVPPRVVTLGGLLQAATPAAAWDMRAGLLRSLVQQPTRLGESYALGRLRVTLDGRAAAGAPGAAAQRVGRATVGHEGDRPLRPRVARARAVLARDRRHPGAVHRDRRLRVRARVPARDDQQQRRGRDRQPRRRRRPGHGAPVRRRHDRPHPQPHDGRGARDHRARSPPPSTSRSARRSATSGSSWSRSRPASGRR